MKNRERAEFLKAHPFRPCGKCFNGLVVTRGVRHGHVTTWAVSCECKRRWKQEVSAAEENEQLKRAG